MISKDIDGNKTITFEFPETRIQLNDDGDLLIRQSNWNNADQQWEVEFICIPRDFVEMFVNSVCDIAGVM